MGKLLNFSSRTMMLFMVLIFWVVSALLMFLGIKMLILIGSFDEAIDNKFLSVPAVVLILLSLLCLVIGIIGCAGASFESRKTQAVFFSLLMLILLLEFVGFILCVVYKDELQDNIDATFKTNLEKYYGVKAGVNKSIDAIQKSLECCGVQAPKDWLVSEWGKDHLGKVPGSCCNTTTKCSVDEPLPFASGQHYTKGCSKKLYNIIKPWLAWLIALAVIFVLVEVLVLTCTCIRMKQSKKVKYQTLSDENPTHGYRA